MGVGRYVCVALPFILTVGSIISLLIAGLAGVTNNGLYIFELDTRNVSIDASTVQSFLGNLTKAENLGDSIGDKVDETTNSVHKAVSQNIHNHDNQISSRSPAPQDAADVSSIVGSLTGSGDNITAAELGIDKIYQFTLWNYCAISSDGSKNCTKAKFNWAEEDLNTSWVDEFGKQLGGNITIPDEVNDTLDTFKTLIKWTEVVYVIAMIGLGLELAVGLFTACSRLVSCLTWVISGFATALVIAAASMMTALAVVVVGLEKGSLDKYGGEAHWSNNFLACVWIGVAFALGASLFWLFSVCCCKPENRPYNRGSRYGGGEKFVPSGSYAPLGENQNTGYNNYSAPQRGGARSDLAYEPYSHAH
ncbi:SUR7/PalI family-domain-containing protein [Daldinia bambusicola]|nr:SUR7/PalI family-domain-containing protein [Daldinia bambusicola]